MAAKKASAKKATAKKKPAAKKAPAKKAAATLPERTPAEQDYAEGRRSVPPQTWEMSEHNANIARAGFSGSLSNAKSTAQALLDSKAKSAPSAATISHLTDQTVTVDTASDSLAGSWNRMMDSPDRPDSAWYFGHNRRLQRTADAHGLEGDRVMQAAAGMSPQNGPDNEFRAAGAMADAVANKRRVTAVSDVMTNPSKKAREKGVQPQKVMSKGETRQLTSLQPDVMLEVTGAHNAKNVRAAPGWDFEGFRSAGTNRRQGFETMKGSANAVDEMETAKAPLYYEAIRQSKPDTPLHLEYEARFTDQDAARKVNKAKDADKAAGRTGSETIRGTGDRVDVHGLMGRGADKVGSDPIHNHAILGKRGIAVPDTWMAALMSGQEMQDQPDSASPAKLFGSLTSSTSANIPGTTFAKNAEIAKRGRGKAMTGNAAWGMVAVEAIQNAATKAREPGSQTSIPPIMLQEMTWTHDRAEVAKSTPVAAAHPDSATKPHMVGNRVAKLTSGSLAGEKEFRPQTGGHGLSGYIDRPGMFSRGFDDPLSNDAVRVTPRPSQPDRMPAPGRAPGVEALHQNAGRAYSEMEKRRSIRSAISAESARKATGQSRWSD